MSKLTLAAAVPMTRCLLGDLPGVYEFRAVDVGQDSVLLRPIGRTTFERFRRRFPAVRSMAEHPLFEPLAVAHGQFVGVVHADGVYLVRVAMSFVGANR